MGQSPDGAAAELVAPGGVGLEPGRFPGVEFQQILGALGEKAVGFQPKALIQRQISQILVAPVQGAHTDGIAQAARQPVTGGGAKQAAFRGGVAAHAGVNLRQFQGQAHVAALFQRLAHHPGRIGKLRGRSVFPRLHRPVRRRALERHHVRARAGHRVALSSRLTRSCFVKEWAVRQKWHVSSAPPSSSINWVSSLRPRAISAFSIFSRLQSHW